MASMLKYFNILMYPTNNSNDIEICFYSRAEIKTLIFFNPSVMWVSGFFQNKDIDQIKFASVDRLHKNNNNV